MSGVLRSSFTAQKRIVSRLNSLARLKSEFPHVRVVALDSGHDIAAGAPADLVASVEGFLGASVDRRGT